MWLIAGVGMQSSTVPFVTVLQRSDLGSPGPLNYGETGADGGPLASIIRRDIPRNLAKASETTAIVIMGIGNPTSDVSCV